MRVSSIVALLLISAPLLAQVPPSCPSNRPVDDFIAEIHKSQSKMKARNKNPLPDFGCIFGWCKQTKAPTATPEPTPSTQTAANTSAGQSSSGKPESVKCDEEMERALEAAHNAEVGDTYFQEKNFRAALFRYQDADQGKPNDAAIEVRLGRVYEKLNRPEDAMKQYSDAAKLSGPEKWVQEAQSALSRLK